MPVTLAASATTAPARKQWTRAECSLLENSDLWDGKHYELVEGELYDKKGKKRPHTDALTFVREWLAQKFGFQFINTEAPIDVAPEDNPASEPEPDIIVLNQPTQHFTANPTPADIRLLVEISHTTLVYDSTVKAGLYARAGIAEYWIGDVISRGLIVHRNPANGAYQSIATYAENEFVSSAAVSALFVPRDLWSPEEA